MKLSYASADRFPEPRADKLGSIHHHMQERTVTTPTSRLVIRIRPGRGLPVVFLSGGPGMPDYLQGIAAMLEGRTVVTYDQRGTGGSRALDGDYSVKAHVSDLESLREYLDASKVHLFGHSWGGMLAQLYATAHIDRTASLFLANPSTGVGSHWSSMEKTVLQYSRDRSSFIEFVKLGAWSVLARLPGALGRRYLARMYGLVWLKYQQPDRAQPADPKILAGVGPRTAFRTRASVVALPDDHLDSVIPRADVPLRVIYGERDIYGARIKAVRQRYPKAEFEVWNGCGHIPWLDDEPRFRAALVSFYARLS